MADEDFMDRIAREVDDQFRLSDPTSIDELTTLLSAAVEDLKTAKIELQDLQRKCRFFRPNRG